MNSKVERYRTKPCEIEAIQWDGQNSVSILKFAGDKVNYKVINDTAWEVGKGAPVVDIYVETLEGTMKANIGDYIIKGLNGEFYPCKSDIFEKKYVKVKVKGE